MLSGLSVGIWGGQTMCDRLCAETATKNSYSYTSAGLLILKWDLFSFLLILGWPCDLLWPIEWDRSNMAPTFVKLWNFFFSLGSPEMPCKSPFSLVDREATWGERSLAIPRHFSHPSWSFRHVSEAIWDPPTQVSHPSQHHIEQRRAAPTKPYPNWGIADKHGSCCFKSLIWEMVPFAAIW